MTSRRNIIGAASAALGATACGLIIMPALSTIANASTALLSKAELEQKIAKMEGHGYIFTVCFLGDEPHGFALSSPLHPPAKEDERRECSDLDMWVQKAWRGNKQRFMAHLIATGRHNRRPNLGVAGRGPSP